VLLVCEEEKKIEEVICLLNLLFLALSFVRTLGSTVPGVAGKQATHSTRTTKNNSIPPSVLKL